MANMLLDLGPLTERVFVRLGDVDFVLVNPSAISLPDAFELDAAWAAFAGIIHEQMSTREQTLSEEQREQSKAAERAARLRVARAFFPEATPEQLQLLTTGHVYRVGLAYIKEYALFMVPAEESAEAQPRTTGS